MARNIEDLTGRRFGRLIVLNREANNKHRKTQWRCKCDCGNETIVCRGELIRGDTKSCGCLAHERLVQYNKDKKTKHGLYGKRIYIVWKDMIYRCEKEYVAEYPHYGGRGIKVCKEWHDVNVFAKWAYSTGYDENAPFGECTLERIDVNGDYCPENCTWVNMFQQNCNRTITYKVDVDGMKQPLMMIAKERGLNYRAIYHRMTKFGDTLEEAIENVIRNQNKKLSAKWANGEMTHEKLIDHDGKTQNITAWAEECNVERRKMSALIAKGYSIAEIKEKYGTKP